MLPLEGFSTEITLKRSFLAVGLHVVPDLVLPLKCLTTHFTVEQLLIKVHSDMLLHLSTIIKCLLAHGTLLVLNADVHLLHVPSVPHCGVEVSMTNATDICRLVGMSTHVGLERFHGCPRATQLALLISIHTFHT